MKKLSVDDAVIYLFAHQDKDNPVQFPDTLVYVVDMYTKYRTNIFLLENIIIVILLMEVSILEQNLMQ